jgi:tetratricopeptide (TPR) repeat protein
MSRKRLKLFAARFRLHYSVMVFSAVILAASCSSYSKIYLVDKVDRLTLVAHQPEKKSQDGLPYKTVRFVERVRQSTPSGQINDRAADLIVEGKFPQASSLLEQLVVDEPELPAAHNNLGIIYEIFGDYARAFDQYSRACALDPENDCYTNNIRNLGYDRR